MITPYQAKVLAAELSRRHASGDDDRLTASLLDARVDLNPHQIEAALFAFRSPLAQGVLLADEVGLGKTIEAALVIAQRWAERRRRILVVVPANLRKQWEEELLEKFHLPAVILETKAANEAKKRGVKNPFEREQEIVICSYQFAARCDEQILSVPWDLVVIDEAHRLRNVEKTGNKIAKTLRTALSGRSKVLLTATPLQNSLLELHGLVSFLDERAFGDAKSFRAQYGRLEAGGSFDDLKARLKPLCHRTLRRQVLEYVNFTKRIPITQEFIPTDAEQRLYDDVSAYLQRPQLQALPASQRQLIVLVMRKLLASSTFAIAGALGTLMNRLVADLKFEKTLREKLAGDLASDYEALDETAEEWTDEDGEPSVEPRTAEQIAALEAEVKDLAAFRALAESIGENAKGRALVDALATGFRKMREIGAAKKAIIFTESRRTQDYLVRVLSERGHSIVLFNGTNSDKASTAIYQEWLGRHRGSDRVTGSKTADMRAALVDFFRYQADVMIATEAAAEGINLQFCSLVVNYDLPWNPQRVEQRIGRCHRYGQKHDVVVVNFLNKKNAADQRVYELLDEKFSLFSGVFGASDEVLGAIESGVDFERRIVEIYQSCRTLSEIEASFARLRADLDAQIAETMADARQKLLENFDADVTERLRMQLHATKAHLSKLEAKLWTLTRYGLDGEVTFDESAHAFTTPEGRFVMAREVADGEIRWRLGHERAQHMIETVLAAKLADAEVAFDYTRWGQRASALAPLVGQRGFLVAERVTLDSSDPEEHVVVSGASQAGVVLDDEQCQRMMELPAQIGRELAITLPAFATDALDGRFNAILADAERRKADWFDEEVTKLDRWADDQRVGLKATVDELTAEVKELNKLRRQATTLPEKIGLQKRAAEREKAREAARRAFEEAVDALASKKERMLDDVEKRLEQKPHRERLFTIEWTLS